MLSPDGCSVAEHEVFLTLGNSWPPCWSSWGCGLWGGPAVAVNGGDPGCDTEDATDLAELASHPASTEPAPKWLWEVLRLGRGGQPSVLLRPLSASVSHAVQVRTAPTSGTIRLRHVAPHQTGLVLHPLSCLCLGPWVLCSLVHPQRRHGRGNRGAAAGGEPTHPEWPGRKMPALDTRGSGDVGRVSAVTSVRQGTRWWWKGGLRGGCSGPKFAVLKA